MIKITLFLLLFCHKINAASYQDTLRLAESGDFDAAYQVANLFLNGEDIAQNRKKGIEWLELAASNNHQAAIQQLADLQFELRRFNVLQKLADINDIDAQFALAYAYRNGIGVKQDLVLAAKWQEIASHTLATKDNSNPLQTKHSPEIIDPVYAVTLPITNLSLDDHKITNIKSISEIDNTKYTSVDYVDGEAIVIETVNASSQFSDKPILIAEATTDSINETENEESTLTFDNLIQNFVSNVNESIPPPPTSDIAITEDQTAKPLPAMLPKPPASIPTENVENPSDLLPDTTNILDFGISHLLEKNWTRNEKPSTYLPSFITNCIDETNRIVCNSLIVKDQLPGRTIKYKTKSLITTSDEGTFRILYRNLVIDTSSNKSMATENIEDEEIGNENPGQLIQTKTGWTKQHKMDCYYTSKKSVRCLKNSKHTIDIEVRNY